MPKAEDITLVRQRRQDLQKMGMSVQVFNHPQPTAQWYRFEEAHSHDRVYRGYICSNVDCGYVDHNPSAVCPACKDRNEERTFPLVPKDVGSTANTCGAGWYAMPNLMPADPHHIRKYEERGWTLTPPDIMEHGQLTKFSEPEPLSRFTVNDNAVPHSIHKYARPMGSRCKVKGCTRVRTAPFKERRKA